MAMTPELPIPISFISGRYLLFSADAATYLRREYNICGVLIGTLPQAPQQNVFLGLPLELMPEEARLLVVKGVTCIVDAENFHNDGMKSLIEEDKRRYMQDLQREGSQATRVQTERKEQQREEALKKIAQKNAIKSANAKSQDIPEEYAGADTDLFCSEPRPSSAISSSAGSIISGAAMRITPPTSYSLLPYKASKDYIMPLPNVPPSYPLFVHLHSRGYFLSPGLRFGCQYMAYPGDPLRFHSHFLVVAADWDQELDLMELVAGGRLGTGVKKAFLLGGAETTDEVSSQDSADNRVRTFSIEWAGM